MKHFKALNIGKSLFEDSYEIIKEIGGGAFGTVYECHRKTDGEKFAAKVIYRKNLKKDKEGSKKLKREIDIMKKVEHPNLVKFIEAFESDDSIVLVTELVEGGELYQKVEKKVKMTEEEVASIISQVIRGANYLHSLHIAHRDIKPENILQSGTNVKITDFGLSKSIADGDNLQTMVGTLDYMAPEVVMAQKYDISVDFWSIGVLTYVLLTGRLPFYSKQPSVTFQKISDVEYPIDGPGFEHISDAAKDFISKLIVKDPEERMTASKCMQHPWLKGLGKTVKLDFAVRKKRSLSLTGRKRAIKPLNNITEEEEGS